MGVEARIEEFSMGTPTAVDAARAVGSKLSQIVKSLVFDCDGRWVVVLVPGDRRADLEKIAAAAGAKKARIAKPDEVERATGFVAGAVAPFPLPNVDRVFVDRGPARSQAGLDRSRLAEPHGGDRAGRHDSARPGTTHGRRRSGHVTFDQPTRLRRREVRETEKIWMNGELVDWGDATVHVGTHGLHYGTGVFEGIRCYETAKGPAVFRLTDHLERLHNSANLLYMQLPYSVDELHAACMDVIAANGLPECYLRPIAFSGYGELGVSTAGNPVEVVIMSWPWGAYLGDDGLKNGIRVKISSWQRVGPNTIPHASKATGIYLNSMLAVTEANRAGYDEAILLTAEGFIADGSGENVFIVKDGKISTPPLSTSILPGITRDSLIQIAQDLGYTVEEKNLIRSDLVTADEIFMTGTAAEVTPIREVDDREIGPPGPVTKELQTAYLDTCRGKSERWAQWLEYAKIGNAAPAEA